MSPILRFFYSTADTNTPLLYSPFDTHTPVSPRRPSSCLDLNAYRWRLLMRRARRQEHLIRLFLIMKYAFSLLRLLRRLLADAFIAFV